MIRAVQEQDAKAISDIYNYYIANTVITFEEDILTAAEMQRRSTSVLAADLPWLVVEDELGEYLVMLMPVNGVNVSPIVSLLKLPSIYHQSRAVKAWALNCIKHCLPSLKIETFIA